MELVLIRGPLETPDFYGPLRGPKKMLSLIPYRPFELVRAPKGPQKLYKLCVRCVVRSGFFVFGLNL